MSTNIDLLTRMLNKEPYIYDEFNEIEYDMNKNKDKKTYQEYEKLASSN